MSIPCQGRAYIGAKAKVSTWVHRQSNVMFTVSKKKIIERNSLSHSVFLCVNEPLSLFTPRESGSENEKYQGKSKKRSQKKLQSLKKIFNFYFAFARCKWTFSISLFYSLEDIVVELVVARKCDEAAPAARHGEEHLDGSISPNLQTILLVYSTFIRKILHSEKTRFRSNRLIESLFSHLYRFSEWGWSAAEHRSVGVQYFPLLYTGPWPVQGTRLAQ